jgi:hypothetical protein
MSNASSLGKKQEIYKKIDDHFDDIPPYKDLISVFLKVCKQHGYSQEAIQEAIIDYLFHGSHYQKYRE